MRKIEIQMNQAIRSKKDWKNDNTSVHFDPETGVAIVRLFGNKIAVVTNNNDLTIFDGGNRSVTTKFRLNAIINEFCNAFTDGVFQSNSKWYIRDNNNVIPFISGYVFS